jgi:MerR family transcriptional regulator, thiopeptide resistance regulator
MKNYSISRLAKLFDLSRSTLLYYDRIGLLPATKRSGSGYRLYTESDRERLERICLYREAGLSLNDIDLLLKNGDTLGNAVLEERLRAIGRQILALKDQQRMIVAMLKIKCDGTVAVADKALWISMMRAAGMDESGMKKWHAEFERQAPEAHYELLRLLGIEEAEAQAIKAWSTESR